MEKLETDSSIDSDDDVLLKNLPVCANSRLVLGPGHKACDNCQVILHCNHKFNCFNKCRLKDLSFHRFACSVEAKRLVTK